MSQRILLACAVVLMAASFAAAEPPVASYIFPAGGRRGDTVPVKVGGLFLNSACDFHLSAPGIQASKRLTRTPTLWFEGPILFQPDSQRQEDYPKDMAGSITLSRAAELGMHTWRVSTSQGATASKLFEVGDLPEVVEQEIDGEPIAVAVQLPVTVNGRIFPRQDIDVWSFVARKGEPIVCDVRAQRLGSPLEARLELLDPQGRRLAESELGGDPRLVVTAPSDGTYQVRIHDINFGGSQSHVYRLTLQTGPTVERVFPLGGRRGQPVTLELAGLQLAQPTHTLTLPKTGDSAFVVLPGNRIRLDLGDEPEFVEGRAPATIPLPATVNGRIAKPGEIDRWTFTAKKGQTLQFDLRAARLGSLLDGVLTVTDSADKELMRAEGGANPDAQLRFTAPADGAYHVGVQDRFRSRGGPAFGYRVRITTGADQPDFRLTFKSDAVTLLRGTTVKLPVQLERLGNFAEPLALTIDGLPADVVASGTTIAAKQNNTEIVFKADATATIRPARLTIRGSAKIGGQETTRQATLLPATPAVGDMPPIDDVLLAVGVATPFKVKGVYDMRWAARGSQHTRRYQLEWGDFTSPLEISLTDKQARHIQGVTGPKITVAPGTAEFDYTITLPPWMETGRTSRVCVMATGVYKDRDGTQHEITYSSVHQNEQVVAVIEPGKLDLDLDRSAVRALPGQSITIPFKASRGAGMKGPIRVELVPAAHVKDVRAEPATLTEQQTEGTLKLTFGPNPGPFNMPLLFRATLTSDNRPYLAETSLDIVPAK